MNISDSAKREKNVAGLQCFSSRIVENKNRGIDLLTAFFMVALQFCLTPSSMAGPPLVTDDPGILDPGAWEVIAAIVGEDRAADKVIQAPLLDVSLGVSANTQLSFVLPRLVVDPEGAGTAKGLAFASVGYKWRFASTDQWEWAIAANYTLPVSHQVFRNNGPEDVRVLGLPVLVAYTHGEWTWLGQAGWNSTGDGTHFWDYGLAASHPLGNSALWMVEVHGNAGSSFSESTLNYQFGLDYEVSPAFHVLAAAGSRIKSLPDPDARLNYSYFIGLQWFH